MAASMSTVYCTNFSKPRAAWHRVAVMLSVIGHGEEGASGRDIESPVR